jgi:hypothetical protein
MQSTVHYTQGITPKQSRLSCLCPQNAEMRREKSAPDGFGPPITDIGQPY